MQEPKLEASSSQPLCALGNLTAAGGESETSTNDTTVTQSGQQDGLIDNQKVCGVIVVNVAVTSAKDVM